MAELTRYLDASLSTGNNDGTTEADAWRSMVDAAADGEIIGAADNLTILCSGGVDAITTAIKFTDAWTITGHLTLAMKVPHAGVYAETGYVAQFNLAVNETGLRVYPGITVDGLIVDMIGTYAVNGYTKALRLYNAASNYAHIDRCIVRFNGTLTDGEIRMIEWNDVNNVVGTAGLTNTLVYNQSGTPVTDLYGVHNNSTPGSDRILRAYNNTVIGFDTNYFQGNNSRVVAKNCIAQDGTTDFSAGVEQTNCISGSGLSFANKAGKDFHLAANDFTALGAGIDLDADALFPVTDDYESDPRNIGTYDIGCDERLVGPSYIGPVPLEYKIGSSFTNFPMATWFSGTGTVTVSSATPLPTGLTDNGDGTLSGQITSSAEVSTVFTATDDVGPTDSTVTWLVVPYAISFSGSKRLEDQDAQPKNSTNFGYSVFKGTVTELVAADTPVVEALAQTVTNGVLNITLPDSELASDDYSVCIEVLDTPNDAEGNRVIPLAILPAVSA